MKAKKNSKSLSPMRRWYTNDRIIGLQILILIVAGIAVAIGMAWLTTRGAHLGWFSGVPGP